MGLLSTSWDNRKVKYKILIKSVTKLNLNLFVDVKSNKRKGYFGFSFYFRDFFLNPINIILSFFFWQNTKIKTSCKKKKFKEFRDHQSFLDFRFWKNSSWSLVWVFQLRVRFRGVGCLVPFTSVSDYRKLREFQ